MQTQTQTETVVPEPTYGWTARLPGRSLKDARVLVADALKEQGFGILTEIDVRETLRQKLGREFKPYVILGACNPNLALQALSEQPYVGLLLPCNVCVWEEDGAAVVSIARPEAMFQVVNQPSLAPIAEEAERRLHAAFQKIVHAAR